MKENSKIKTTQNSLETTHFGNAPCVPHAPSAGNGTTIGPNPGFTLATGDDRSITGAVRPPPTRVDLDFQKGGYELTIPDRNRVWPLSGFVDDTLSQTIIYSDLLTSRNDPNYMLPKEIRENGGETVFSFFKGVDSNNNEFHAIVPTHGARQSTNSVSGYWIPQGKFVDIPINPGPHEPKHIFTPSFSGCAFVADKLDGKTLRVYHVEGNKEDAQYNHLQEHGDGMVSAMQYQDYGFSTDVSTQQVMETTHGFAFFRYEAQGEGSTGWRLHFQRLDNAMSGLKEFKRKFNFFSKESFTVEGMKQMYGRVISAEKKWSNVGEGLETKPGRVIEERWLVPDLDQADRDYSEREIRNPETALKPANHDYQIIVQLQGDDVSGRAALALRGKHAPKYSTLMQLRDGTPWIVRNAGAHEVAIGEMLLSGLEGEGRLRLTYVGHGNLQGGETTFGGLKVQSFVATLNNMFERVGKEGNVKEITLNLVGCHLDDRLVGSGETFAGQVADALPPLIERAGIDPERVVIHARDGRVSVDPLSGQKNFITSEGQIIAGDLGDAYKLLHQTEYVFDAKEGRHTRKPLSLDTLHVAGELLLNVHNDETQSEHNSELIDTLNAEHAKAFGERIGRPSLTIEHKSIHEQAMLEIKRVHQINTAKEAAINAGLVAARGQVDIDLRHIPSLIRKNESGNDEIAFGRIKEGGGIEPASIEWIDTNSSAISVWREHVGKYANFLNAGVKILEVGKNIGKHIFSGSSEAEAVHTMNAAFLLQTLLSCSKDGELSERDVLFGTVDDAIKKLTGKEPSELPAKDLAILKQQLAFQKMEAGFNFTQQAMGIVQEIVGIAKIVGNLRQTLPSWLKMTGKLGGVPGGVGMGFDIANVVFAAIAFSNAKTDTQKTVAGAQLGVSVVSLGIGTTATVAGVYGALATGAGAATATSLASFLGPLGVPIAGLSIGITSVVSAYGARADRIGMGLGMLDDVAAGVAKFGVHMGDYEAFQTHPSAVISEIDFANNTLHYGEVWIQGSIHRSRIIAPESTAVWLKFYEAFGLNSQAVTAFSEDDNCELLILPYALSKAFTYHYNDSPGWRHHSAPGADRLELYFNGENDSSQLFYWWRYTQALIIFGGWDYVIDEVKVINYKTPVKVVLDQQQRTIQVPPISDSVHRSYLSYQLVGGGGDYALVVASWPVDIEITFGADGKETWLLDLTAAAIDRVAPDRVASDQVADDEKETWITDVVKTLQWTPSALVLGTQTISFVGGWRKALTVKLAICNLAGASLMLKLEETNEITSFVMIDSPDNAKPDNVKIIGESISKSGLSLANKLLLVVLQSERLNYMGILDIDGGDSVLVAFDSEAKQSIVLHNGVVSTSLDFEGVFDSASSGQLVLKNEQKQRAWFITESGAPVFDKFTDGDTDFSDIGGNELEIFHRTATEVELCVPTCVSRLMKYVEKIIVRNYNGSGETNGALTSLLMDKARIDPLVTQIAVDMVTPVCLKFQQPRASFKYESEGSDMLLIGEDGRFFRLINALLSDTEAGIKNSNLSVSFENASPLSIYELIVLLEPDHPIRKEFGRPTIETLSAQYGVYLSTVSGKEKNILFFEEKRSMLATFETLSHEPILESLEQRLADIEQATYGNIIHGSKNSAIRYYLNDSGTAIFAVEHGQALRNWLCSSILPIKINRITYQEDGADKTFTIEGLGFRMESNATVVSVATVEGLELIPKSVHANGLLQPRLRKFFKANAIFDGRSPIPPVISLVEKIVLDLSRGA